MEASKATVGGRTSEARFLFKRFLAERWFGGPDFESWIRQHEEVQEELRRLRDEWLAELRDPDSPGLPLGAEGGARTAASFRAGELLGGFRLRERIGAGASGEVWLAEDLALKRVVAIKLLRPDLALNAHATERFRREALAAARVKHPGVVTVFSIGNAHGQPFIVQELIEGGRTLATWVAEARERGTLGADDFRQAAAWVAQAADALAAAHAEGIYHRDIKPQNLLLAPDGRVKVADFGLAHLTGEQSISLHGDVLGTVPYMSPSQVRGEVEELDARSDVFSLGATLYELLTLERAFPGRTLPEIAYSVQYEDPLPPRRVQHKLPRDIECVVLRALEKDVSDRYQSMSELAADLRRFLAGEPPLARGHSLASRLRRWRRRHPTLAASAAVALVAAGALGWLGWALQRREGQRIEARVRTLQARAQLEIELGDIGEASKCVLEADELAQDDPIGHLILAVGYQRQGRTNEMERELQLALARGFATDPARLESAIEHAGYALLLLCKRDLALYPEVERHIARALELDSGLYVLEFTRYLIRDTLGDEAGSRAALLDFWGHVAPGEPMFPFVEALRLECDGDPARALAVLESMGESLSEADRTAMHWHRNAGRLCVRMGELERAEELLLRAVSDDPQDCWSLDALGAVYQKRLQSGDCTAAVFEGARRYAGLARACAPTLPNPNYVDAYVAERELALASGIARPREHPAWKEARAALDRLHELGAGDTETTRALEAHLGELEAHFLLLEALPLYEDGRYTELVEPLAGALEVDPGNLQIAALLGESLYWSEQPARGLDVLAHGLARWDDPRSKIERAPQWLGVMLAFGLANAGKLGDRAAFERVRARLELELERGVSFANEELLNAARYLAAAPEEFRDCALAWRLIDAHDLDTAFAATGSEETARTILAEIASACP